MVQLNLFPRQERRHRHREETWSRGGGGGGGGGQLQEGRDVLYLQLVYFIVQQKLTQYYKAIIKIFLIN